MESRGLQTLEALSKAREDGRAPARELVEAVYGSIKFSARRGMIISFFPLDDEAVVSHSEGLKWPLTGINWDRSRFGISNVVMSEKVEIRVRKGRLLMVKLLNEDI